MHLMQGDFQIEGRPAFPDFDVDKPAVSPGYFRAMGIRLLRGRDFSDDDGIRPRRRRIVSQSVARMIVAFGRCHRQARDAPDPSDSEDWLTVIGVVKDVKQ